MMIFGREPTPEEEAELRERIEKSRMQSQAFDAEMDHWLDELGPRETFLLSALLKSMLDREDGTINEAWVGVVVGRLQSKMRYKYNVNPLTGLPDGVDFFADPDWKGKAD